MQIEVIMTSVHIKKVRNRSAGEGTEWKEPWTLLAVSWLSPYGKQYGSYLENSESTA